MVDPHDMDMLTNSVLKYVDRFCTTDKIGNIKTPIIIYHGMKDTLIECKHSLHLQKVNKEHTSVILLKEAGHNDILIHIDMRELWNIIFNHINS